MPSNDINEPGFMRERLRPQAIEPGTLDPKESSEFVAAELKRWVPLVRAPGA